MYKNKDHILKILLKLLVVIFIGLVIGVNIVRH
jgi:hypothetical protein